MIFKILFSQLVPHLITNLHTLFYYHTPRKKKRRVTSFKDCSVEKKDYFNIFLMLYEMWSMDVNLADTDKALS